MEVGLLMIFQNYMGEMDDAEMVKGQMRIADLAEPLGFDKIWPPEHHFTDYSACPDNIQFLSWLAGRTERIKLGTGAVIVPWNDPLRVAEKMALLDHLSNGRAVLGLGRGLSRLEYGHFGIDMGESRDRFDEASRMIIDALDSGEIEGAGPYYPQVRTPIRPRPLRGFRDRFYAVGMSPESIDQAAALDARLMVFSQMPWELFAEGPLDQYRKTYAAHHSKPAPPPLTGDLMYCHADPAVAEERAMKYMPNYFMTIVRHYELMNDHFKKVGGYDFYGDAAEAFKLVGLEVAVKTYCGVQAFGTPDMILKQLERRRELLGPFELNLISYYGGMPIEEAEASIRLFSEEVLPELHRW